MLVERLAMGGYGWYVYASYAIVFVTLITLWLVPWLRWRKFLKQHSRPKTEVSAHE